MAFYGKSYATEHRTSSELCFKCSKQTVGQIDGFFGQVVGVGPAGNNFASAAVSCQTGKAILDSKDC